MTKKLFAALIAAIALLMLNACGGGSTDEAGDTQTATDGQEFNGADVAFATEMIPHHAQALVMVDMTQGRELDPEVRELTEQIRAAQAPEIEQMSEWLQSWDEPVPETDGASMDMGSNMSGMMSEQQMTDLEAAQGEDFQRMWLEMMIEHHQGAIEMAQAEQAEGTFEPAVELAEEIETAQQQEIATMEDLLSS